MNRRDEVIAPSIDETEPTFTGIFLQTYQKEVGEIIRAIPHWIDMWSKSSSRLKMTLVILLMLLVGGTMGIVTYMTLINKISGEALIFLAGTILGYIFAFLQKYLGLIQSS